MSALYPILRDELYGYMDQFGDIKLDFLYDHASDESDGTLIICAGGQWALIDQRSQNVAEISDEIGKGLIVPIARVSDGRGGLMRFTGKHELLGFVDSLGNIAITPRYDRAFDFSEGVAGASLPSDPRKFGFINFDGDWHVPPIYRFCHSMHDGFAAVQSDDRLYSFIDGNGLLRDVPKFAQVARFSEGLAMARVPEEFPLLKSADRDNRTGYIDRNMEFVIEPQFYCGRNFSSRVAAVATKHGDYYSHEDQWCVPLHWGLCDSRGQVTALSKYSYIGEFSDGLCPVAIGGHFVVEGYLLGGKWGYVNAKHEEVIPCQYAHTEPFDRGVGKVHTCAPDFTKKWLLGTEYLNQQGELLWKNA